ncbi:hypothetical protein FB45DRAFT_999905 [Roridomyces roridus]|uniref:Poly(A) RNA polymerase mitochondrial-like central palm domain-containing protein n=1 Tax=Roridomyces roridus TaxID=1738132 RepID=A0AAD7FSQ8_9AGAR|nr:hypothetical protein FB45DRAFT_999905 [Roridomyces roridus]
MEERPRGREAAGDASTSRPDAKDDAKPRQKRKRSPPPVAPEDEPVLTPWLSLLASETVSTTTEQRLHHEIVAFAAWVQPTSQETTARHALREMIQQVIRLRFPAGELQLFGSEVTGLCLPTGDMDLAVMLREDYSQKEKKKPLFKMADLLKSARITWDVEVKHHARVPILSFTSLPNYGSFSVDIGINNTDGPRAVELVKGFLTKIPALRPLVLVMKAFLSQRSLNDPAVGGLGSYCLLCMCISFLQLNPTNRPREYLDKPMETLSLGALLTDWLFYYGTQFPYATSYISATEGRIGLKEQAEWVLKKNGGGLAIECLVNPGHDVGRSVSRLEAIRDAFKEGYKAMLELGDDVESTLKVVMGVTQRTMDRRAHIKRIVDNGVLEVPAARPPLRERSRGEYHRRNPNQKQHPPQRQHHPQPQRQQQHPQSRPTPRPAPESLSQRQSQPDMDMQPRPPSQPRPQRHPQPQSVPLLQRLSPAQIPHFGLELGAGSAMGRGGGAGDANGNGSKKPKKSFASGSGSGSGYGSGYGGWSASPSVVPAPYPGFDPEWPPKGKESRREKKRRRLEMSMGA